MNGKKAKLLRRLARENTIGAQDVNYHGFTVNDKSGHKMPLLRLDPACTRAEVKRLKRQFNQRGEK